MKDIAPKKDFNSESVGEVEANYHTCCDTIKSSHFVAEKSEVMQCCAIDVSLHKTHSLCKMDAMRIEIN